MRRWRCTTYYFFLSPFPIHRTYFWVSPPQMALQGFFHVKSLFASPVHSRKTWIHRPTGIVRERSHMVGKEEEGRRKSPEKKPLRRDRDLNPLTLSPEPSVLSIRPRRPAHERYPTSICAAWSAQKNQYPNSCIVSLTVVCTITELRE